MEAEAKICNSARRCQYFPFSASASSAFKDGYDENHLGERSRQMAETQAQPGRISAGGVLRVPEVTNTQPATRDSISAAERGLQCRFKLESSLCL